jgi:hypothetical protein
MFSRGYWRAWKTKRLALWCRIFSHKDTPDPRTELLFYVDFETFLQPISHGDHESELWVRAERCTQKPDSDKHSVRVTEKLFRLDRNRATILS